MPGGTSSEAIYELCRVQDHEFTYKTASLDETIALCGLEKLLKGGNTNLPLAASIKIQARAKGMLQRKKDKLKRAEQQEQPPPPEMQAKQASPRAPAADAAVALPAVEPPMSLDSLPKGIRPNIVKLAKSVAEQMVATSSANDSLAAMGAAHERAAVAEAELAVLQAKASKLQNDIASVRSETLDGFKAKLSTALAEVSSIEREVRVQVCARIALLSCSPSHATHLSDAIHNLCAP